MFDFWGLNRRKVLINPSDQLRLALSLFVYIAIYSIILGFIIFYPLYNYMNAAQSIEQRAAISQMVLYLHSRVWVGFFLVAVLASVHVIFSTQKMVGPVYRFQTMVRELIRGNFGAHIKIRKNDRFKEMEGLLNRLADELDLQRNRERQFYLDMKARLETISAMLEAEGAEYPDDVKRLTQELIRELGSKAVKRH